VEGTLGLRLDQDRIGSFRSFSHRELGIREAFVQPRIGGARTVGVLSTPIDAAPTGGWVICHSFALEQVYLQPLETALARAMAAAGHAVLRFHGQGYGDSDRGTEHASLRSHVDDARDAAGVLAEEAGVERIGFAGLRLGGTVATLAADEARAAGLVAAAPAIDGSNYMGWMTKQARLTAVSTGEEALPDDPVAELMAAGTLDVLGFPLRREVYDEISSLDVLGALRGFRGEALVLQVSRSGDPDPDLERLAERLWGLGARVDLHVLEDPAALRLGLPRYRRSKQGRKEDTQGGLSERVVAAVAAWSRDRRWQGAAVGS